MARQMYENKTIPVRDICKALGIPLSTFYKYMKNHVGSKSGRDVYKASYSVRNPFLTSIRASVLGPTPCSTASSRSR
jgi:Helix-turn-helix domain of resolvase